MITSLKVGDRVKVKEVEPFNCHEVNELVGRISVITEEWIWVDWGFGDTWNHKSNNLERVVETKK